MTRPLTRTRTRTRTRALACALSALSVAALPAASHAAGGDSRAYFTRSHAAALPRLLNDSDRAWYAGWFAALDAKQWPRLDALLAERGDGPLHGAALAAYYLAPDSPRIELARIEAWLARYADLPEAEAIVRLGRTRGLAAAPSLAGARELVRQPGTSRRTRPGTTADGTMPADVSAAILERIDKDDPDAARILLDGIDASLSQEARAEWRQRVAWSYYIENLDPQALALAETVRANGAGEWVAEGDFTAGLAAWRLGACDRAAAGFRRAAGSARNPELTAAAHYWAGRALVRCRQPEDADEQWRGAARYPETLYGMLAREQLGQALPADHTAPDLTAQDWQRLATQGAVREAVMLAELGRREAADAALRWQVRSGPAQDFAALARLARAMGLAATQSFMAQNAPRGSTPPPALRFPVAYHQPVGGWRIDPALAFAHALQESNFREGVVSPANAIGLMQVRPIAAREYAGSIGMDAARVDLKDPATNLAFGQRALEALARDPGTQGRLPKVMAAYNAGPTPVQRWNGEIRDQGDPLLWMESIPYWETRSYVAIVMRNYWMYLRQADAAAPSRSDLAQNRWPQFPGVR